MAAPSTSIATGSPLWAQLVSDRLSASLICDGFHLPKEVVQAFVRAKSVERCILITDATHLTGLKPGKYSLGTIPVELHPDGCVRTLITPSSFGGSTLRMNDAVYRFFTWTGLPIAVALEAASGNPARLLGRPGVCCEIAVGQPANLVFWQLRDAGLRVKGVCRAGERMMFGDAEGQISPATAIGCTES